MPQSETKSEDFVERVAELESSDYDAIFDFLEELRTIGFRFGTQQYIDLHRVLVTLIAGSQTALNTEKLKTYLAPVVCTSPAEQDAFYSQFDNWLKQRNIAGKNNKTELPTLADSLAQQAEIIRPRRKWRRVFAYAGLTLLVISAILVPFSNTIYELSPYTLRKKVGTVRYQVVDEEKMMPLSGAEILINKGSEKTDQNGEFTLNYNTRLKKNTITVNYPNYPLKIETLELLDGEQNVQIKMKQQIQTVPLDEQEVLTAVPVTPDYWNQFYRRYFIYLAVVAALAPILYFCLWWLLRQRRRARLARKQSDEIPHLNKLIVKGVTEILYKNAELRRAIQELRRHRPQDSTDLNIPATIDATINRGGLPKPIYGTRKTSPEYLILIDRANFSDQEALLKDVLINRLIEEGVYVDRYYFDRDPRICYKTPQSKTLSLPELAARYPEHNLAIFSDGASFLDPLTALPQRWLEMFSLWVRRALLTPASFDSWGYRETILTESDFPVLPATKQGIAALVDVVNTGQMPKIALNKTARRFPEILEERPLRWLDRHAPGQSEIDELYRQLRRYLDAEEFYLLCACAVYPALSLELTLYLGYKLGGEVERLEDELFSLVRLPWFRHGKMPDWLRQRLVSGLSAGQAKEIRTVIEQLLITAIEHPQEGIEMEFAFDAENYKKGRKKLQRFILGEPEDSPLRDYVFLSFITRSRLTVAVPEVLRRILFPEGVHWLGVRPATVFLLVLLISLGGTTATAYFLPTPVNEEVVAPPIAPISPPEFSRTVPFLSYSPASGIRGSQYKMRFVSNDCGNEKLSNAELTSPEGNGITVLSNQAEGECVHNATIEIAKDAKLGAQTLFLTRRDEPSESFQFTVEDVVTPTRTPTPAVSPTPQPLPPRNCPQSEMDCPPFLIFDEKLVSEPIEAYIIGRDNRTPKFNWTFNVDDSKIFSSVSDGSSLKIIARQIFSGEPNLSYNLTVTSPDDPSCIPTRVGTCNTKARYTGDRSSDPKQIPIANVSPVSFSIYYQFDEPVKGWRRWQRIDNTSWTETYPNGVVSYFKVVGRLTDVFGNNGTLIAKIKGGLGDTPDDGSFQVFIPDVGSKDMTALFRHSGGNWGSLGEMQNVR